MNTEYILLRLASIFCLALMSMAVSTGCGGDGGPVLPEKTPPTEKPEPGKLRGGYVGRECANCHEAFWADPESDEIYCEACRYLKQGQATLLVNLDYPGGKFDDVVDALAESSDSEEFENKLLEELPQQIIDDLIDRIDHFSEVVNGLPAWRNPAEKIHSEQFMERYSGLDLYGQAFITVMTTCFEIPSPEENELEGSIPSIFTLGEWLIDYLYGVYWADRAQYDAVQGKNNPEVAVDLAGVAVDAAKDLVNLVEQKRANEPASEEVKAILKKALLLLANAEKMLEAAKGAAGTGVPTTTTSPLTPECEDN